MFCKFSSFHLAKSLSHRKPQPTGHVICSYMTHCRKERRSHNFVYTSLGKCTWIQLKHHITPSSGNTVIQHIYHMVQCCIIQHLYEGCKSLWSSGFQFWYELVYFVICFLSCLPKNIKHSGNLLMAYKDVVHSVCGNIFSICSNCFLRCDIRMNDCEQFFYFLFLFQFFFSLWTSYI